MNKKLLLLLSIIPLTSCNVPISLSSDITTSSEEISITSFEDSSSSLSLEESSDEDSSSESIEPPSESTESSSTSESEESSEEETQDEITYDDFFNPESDVRLEIRISNENASRCMEWGEIETKQDIYSPIDIKICVNDKEMNYQDAGMRVKGNMSRWDSTHFFNDDGTINGHGHFKIAFNETFKDNEYFTSSIDNTTLKARRFIGSKKIDIKWNRNYDGTFTKEAYADHIFEEEGLMAQKINLVKIKFITDNDSKEFIYQALEVIDEDFLKRRLPEEDAKGDLYKCGWVDGNNLSLTDSSTSLMGVEDKPTKQYYTYDLKTNKKKSTHASLINLINTLNINDYGVSDISTLKEHVESVVDVDYFLKWAALEWVIGNPDSMRYNYNNTYLYFNSSNGLLYPIMFDNDRCFGIIKDWDAVPARWPITTKDINLNMQPNPLYQRLICGGNDDHPLLKEYQDRYLEYVEEYVEKYLNPDRFYEYSYNFYTLDNIYPDNNYSFEDYAYVMEYNLYECLNNR